jgi:pimeloyl-ACP methyl ester carboxylesterase
MKSQWIKLNKKSDYSYPYRLERYRPGLFNEKVNKNLLIVVHGYSSNPYAMNWLMETLGDQLFNIYSVYQFSFETYDFSKNQLSLELASRELGSEISRVIREDNIKPESVAFVGHSTGGLIVRRAFLDNRNLFKAARFVFLGTPHFGSEAADLKNVFVRKDKQTRELAPASDFIWRLNRDWNNMDSCHIDRALSIVGTKSTRVIQWGLPRGEWAQADGVVRSTSAVISFPDSKCFVLYVLNDHTDLRKIPDDWRKLGSLRKKAIRSIPNVSNDLPTVATIIFLRDKEIRKHEDLWKQCIDYFECLEQSYRTALIHEKNGWKELPNGKWAPVEWQNPNMIGWFDDEPYIEPITDPRNMILDAPPVVPEFILSFKEYLKSLEKFWYSQITGSLILRLDYTDIPPVPKVLKVVNLSNQLEIEIPKGSFLRCGERWVTLWIPLIPKGRYELKLEHSGQFFKIEVEIVAHFLTAVEIDASTKVSHNISGDLLNLKESFETGLSALSKEINRSSWEITGDPPRVIVLTKE